MKFYIKSLYRPRAGMAKILLVMKLIVALLTASILQVSASSFAQKITLSEKNSPLEEVLKKIRQQTGFDFLYGDKMLSSAKKINIKIVDAQLTTVLDQIFAEQTLTYQIQEKVVIIKKKEPSFLDRLAERWSSIDVRGVVVDAETGQALAGASVKVKDGNQSTTTDAKGSFVLKNVDESAVIQISYIGFEALELPAKKSMGYIKLKLSENALDEVVFKGYYSESRRLSTSNVGKVTATTITKQPVSNPLATLQGRVPGLIVTQNTGSPGGSFSVQIRGRNSINSANDPFVVVDGVPFTATTISTGMSSSVGNGSALNNINPADIESIEVLKDADALAIYGSRGANGAILITTKKGKIGKTRADVSFYQGIGNVNQFMDLLNTEQYLEMRKEAFANDGQIPSANPNAALPQKYAPDVMLWDNSRYTDWQKVLIGGTAQYTDGQVSLSGGNSNTQFLVGAGFHRETTVNPTDFADKKTSVRFSLNHTSENKKFKMLFSGSYLDNNNNLIKTDITYLALSLPPNAPSIYTPDGTLNWENSTWSNPYANFLNVYNGNTGNLIGNVNLSYEILKGLNLKTSLGYTTLKMKEVGLSPFGYFNPATKPASTTTQFNDNSLKTWLAEPQFEYNLALQKSKISVLVGSTFQENQREGGLIVASGYTSDALLRDIRSATALSVFNNNYSRYRYNAVFARFNYNYDDKYIVNLTGRRDGSSRFGPGKQFSTFAAAGVAWVFSNERLIKENLPFLSSGKLRGSYGSSGSDLIGDYKFLDLWLSTTNLYLGVKGLYANNLFNPDYAWEVNRKLEGGINLGFANDRITVSASYYRNRSGNQLIGKNLPSMTGFSSITENLDAVVENTGWELELNTVNFQKNNFNWSTSFNITIPKAKLLSYPGYENSLAARLVYAIGYPLNVAKTYDFIGVNPQTGTYEFLNNSGSATVSPSALTDRNLPVSLYPKYYGGLQNQIGYKSLSLEFFFQFVKQTGLNYLSGTVFNYAPGMLGNQPGYVMDRWRNAGDETDVQIFTQNTGSNANRAYSSTTSAGENKYSDASFIRLKNVSLSYALPEKLFGKLKMQGARIYLQGQNILTITNYKGLDPETQSLNNLPVLRVLSAGVQLTF